MTQVSSERRNVTHKCAVPRATDEILSEQRLPAIDEIFPIQVLPKPVSGVHNARPANEVVGGAERQDALKKDVAVS